MTLGMAGLGRMHANMARRLINTVSAAVVDETVAALLSLLEPGDIWIDGGNAYFVDETTPLRDPEHYYYDFDPGDITKVWRRGSKRAALAEENTQWQIASHAS